MDLVADVKAGRARPHDLYRMWGGCFHDEVLTEEGNAFTRAYFDFQGGKYLDDYAATLQRDLPTGFHVVYLEENYQRLAGVLRGRFALWNGSRPSRGG